MTDQKFNPYEYRACNTCEWKGPVRACRTLRPSTDPLCPECGETTEHLSDTAPPYEADRVDEQVDNAANDVEHHLRARDFAALNALLASFYMHVGCYHHRVPMMLLRASSRARDYLPAWDELYLATREQLENEQQNVNRIMRGLRAPVTSTVPAPSDLEVLVSRMVKIDTSYGIDNGVRTVRIEFALDAFAPGQEQQKIALEHLHELANLIRAED